MKITLPAFITAAFLLSFAFPVFAGDEGWTTNYAKAVEDAKTDDKAILLNFTGSDWCEWCMKMKTETLDTPMFRDYASQNLVLVTLDFPNHVPQSATVKAQNQKLSQKYGVTGFPTFVVLNKNGKVLWSQVGYLAGGAPAFLAQLKKFYKAPPRTAGAGGTGGGDDFDSFFKKPAQSPTP
jgi:thioredoxin-related protein